MRPSHYLSIMANLLLLAACSADSPPSELSAARSRQALSARISLDAELWPSLSFEPASVVFHPQLAGTSSPAVEVLVRNEQSQVLKSLVATVTGPFHVSPTTIDLDANGSQVLSITFAPTESDSGQVNGGLFFFNGDPSAPVNTLPLQGTAVHTWLISSDSELDFGGVEVGEQASRTVMLTNLSTLPVTLSSVPTTPPFTTVLPEERTLAAWGGTLSFQVVFAPQEQQIFDRSTNINSDTTAPPLALRLKGRGTQSALVLTPASVEFGDTLLGEQNVKSVRLQNDGDAAVDVQATTGAPFRVLDFPTTKRLGPGQFIDFHVGFSPVSSGSANGQAVFYQPDGTQLLVLELSGRAVGPDPVFVPADALEFGAVELGKACGPSSDAYNPNVARTVTIQNRAGAEGAMKIKSITASPPFRLLPILPKAPTPTDPLIIAPGQSQTLEVCFEPTRLGTESNPETGQLTLSYASSQSRQQIALSGHGEKPALGVSPTSVAFGAVELNVPHEETLRLTNTSGLFVHLSEITTSSPLFTFSGLSWPMVLGPHDTVELVVSFTPTQVGNFTATLNITSDNANSPKVGLSGVGAYAQASLNASFIPFPKVQVGQSSEPQTVTVENRGTAVLMIDGATVEGAFSSSLPARGAGVAIEPGDDATFTVSFNPDTPGHLTGKLTLRSNSRLGPQTIELTGEGVGIVEVLPHSLEVGSTNVGNQSAELSLLLHNRTAAPVKITSITSTAPDEFITPQLIEAKTVLADGFYTLPLRFKPTRLGATTGSLKITLASAPVESLEAALSGTGTSPNLELSPSGVMSFGGVRVGTPSLPDAGVLTLFNRGSLSPDADAGFSSVLTVSRLEITGQNQDSFLVDPGLVPQDVQPGGQLRLPVTFRPKDAGAKAASLRITTGPLDGGTGGEIRVVSLDGTGLSSLLELSASELDFRTQVGGRLSAPRTFRLTNRGARSLRVASVVLAGQDFPDFSMELEDASTGAPLSPPFELEAGKAAEVSVRCTPRMGASSSALVRILTEDGDDVSVALKGTGISNDLGVDPSGMEVDFGTVLAPASASGTSKLLTLTNQSAQPITLVAPSLEGPNPEHFQLADAWTQERVLAPNERTTLKVGYQAPVATSSEAVLVVRRKESTSAEGLRLRLTGQAVVNLLEASSTSLDFDWVDLGSESDPREVILTNKSRVARAVRVVEQTNPAFVVDDGKLSALLEPGESTTLRVTFRPSARGTSTGQLRLRMVGENSADIVIELTGQVRALDGHGGGCGASGGGAMALLGLLAWAGCWRRRAVRS